MGGLSARRQATAPVGAAALREFLDGNRLVAVLIFVVTVAAIVAISSLGMTTFNLPVLPNQIATMRIAAGQSFTYVSGEKTRQAREQIVARIPPVYRIDLDGLQRFESGVRNLLTRLSVYEAGHPGVTASPLALADLADDYNAAEPYRVSADDLAAFLSAGDAPTRAALFENGLAAIREIYAEGVHDSSLAGENNDELGVFQIEHANGEVAARPVESMEDALTFLRVSLASGGVSRPVAQALFRFFRRGVSANLVYDNAATQRRVNAALQTVKPVSVHVPGGQVIIDAGERVGPEQYEMFRAYQAFSREHGDAEFLAGLTLFEHVLLVLAMVVASILYIRLEDPETMRSNVRLGLLALVVIFNLTLVRLIYSLGGADFFLRDGSWAATLPYVAPTALAPLIVAILIDAGSGIFMALLISIFTGVIYGNRVDLLVLTFLASMVAIFFCRDARQRGKVVRAAGAGGLTVAAFAALIAFAEQTPLDTLAREMTAGLLTGLFTGVVVVGLLPVLESLFKRTTDITLLELTDYNHPLLRRMQLEAPGTYHHSLVVAQLSENACNAIGANPLLARVCALFHDIGKTVNSGYFTENIRERANPHDRLDPLVSARIIIRHVSDGVELAHKHRLPSAIVAAIREHHGTTHVRYFHEKALAAREEAGDTGPFLDAPFRYPGPKPQTRESAVISIADAVEAASRTLRSATAEQLGQLIDVIVANRMTQHQLNETPLTLEDLAKIKNSFTFTLLNMLHSRVAYATEATGPEVRDEPSGAAPAAAPIREQRKV